MKLEELKMNQKFRSYSGEGFIYRGYEPYDKQTLRLNPEFKDRHKIERVSDGKIFHTSKIICIKY